MLLQPITVQFSKSTLKPSVYTLRGGGNKNKQGLSSRGGGQQEQARPLFKGRKQQEQAKSLFKR